MGNILKRLFFLGVFFMFINSMYPWFVWNNKISVLTLLFTTVIGGGYLIFKQNDFKPITINTTIILLIIFFTLIYTSIGASLFGWLSALLLFWVLIILIKLRYDILYTLLQFITKYLAIILLISLICYILFLLGINFYHPDIYKYYDGRYESLNYFAFIIPYGGVYDFFRFKSIFMEPGHMCMGLIPLIMANKINTKNRYVIILIIAVLFSFSLAGFVTLTIGFLLLKAWRLKLKQIIKLFLIVLLVVLTINAFFGSEVWQYYIFDRLEFDKSSKTIAGDNRVSIAFESIYRQFIKSDYLLFGDKSIDVTAYGAVSGFKKYIVMYGIVGCVITILMYISYFLVYKKNRYYLFAFSLIFILLLIQNAYPFWYCMIISYILGSNNYIYNNSD